jgi:hypothetical protein
MRERCILAYSVAIGRQAWVIEFSAQGQSGRNIALELNINRNRPTVACILAGRKNPAFRAQIGVCP